MQWLSMCLEPVVLFNLKNKKALVLCIQTPMKGFT